MKTCITIFLLISFQYVFSQKTYPALDFTLTGQIKNMPNGKIILSYGNYEGHSINDTMIIQNGHFEFSGQISQPTYAIIKSLPRKDENYTGIYIEASKQKIFLTNDSFAFVRMEGSVTQNENEVLGNIYREIEKKWNMNDAVYDKAVSDWLAEKDTTMRELKHQKVLKFRFLMDSVNEEMKIAKISFVKNHPNSYVSADNLFLPILYMPFDSTWTLYENLSFEIKQSRIGQDLLAKLNLKKSVMVGSLAPNFSASSIVGKEINLSSFKGKYILLDFWASWCAPCREAIPHLKELYQQYHSSGFEIISISIDKKKADWEKAVKQEEISDWNNVLVNEKIDKYYENVRLPIPSSILINKDGVIVWKSDIYKGSVGLDEFLKEAFKR